jgi:hypothetical protein
MTTEERDLLVAVSRWAHRAGWTQHWRGWINATYDSDATLTVGVDEGEVRIWRREPGKGFPLRSTDYLVAGVRQGVDLLCVLGVLPAWMSSLWQAGVSAGIQLAGETVQTAVSAA